MAYPATVLADTPTAFWRMQESSGSTTSADSSGNGYTLNQVGSVAFGQAGLLTESATSVGINQSGENGFNSAAGGSDFSPGSGDFAVEFWVKTSNSGLMVLYGSNGDWCGLESGVATIAFSSTHYHANTNIADGVRHHVFFCRASGSIRIYVDGVLDNSPPTATGSWGGTSQVNVGHFNASGYSLVGNLEEVAWYKGTALSDARVAAHHAAGVASAAATSYSMAATSGGSETIGVADTLTLVANGPTTATVTLARTGLSGSFSSTTVNLNGTTPVTATFTPSATTSSPGSISATNSGSLANPSAIAVNVGAASALTAGTLTGGSVAYNSVSVSFTQATGGSTVYSDILQRSPHSAGTWTNISGATASPATDGTVTASTAYDYRVAYSDGSSTVYSNVATATTPSAPAGPASISFTDVNVHLYGFHGNASSVVAIDPGAYILVGFSGTSITIGWSALPSGAGMSYQVDGGGWTDTTASTGVAITGLSSGNHSLWLMLNVLSQGIDEWTASPPANSVTLTSLTIDAGAASVSLALTPRPLRPNGTWLIYGDSIIRGVQANSGSDAARYSVSFFLAQAIGAEVVVVGKGYQGYASTGAPGANVPTFASTYPYYYNTTARSYAGLSGIFVEHGTNDQLNNPGASDAVIASIVATTINGIRAKMVTDGIPNAPLMIGIPCGGSGGVQYRKTAITNGVASATANANNKLCDPGPELVPGASASILTGDGVHPTFQRTGTPAFADAYASAIAAAKVAIAAASGGASTATSYSVLGIPSSPVANETYPVVVVLNGPAASALTATFGAATGITWGGAVTIAGGANSGTTTVLFSAAGSYTPTVTHTGGGSGITADPTISAVTATASSSTNVNVTAINGSTQAAANLMATYTGTLATIQSLITAIQAAGVKLTSDGMDNVVIETGVNPRQALSVILASAGGKVAGADTGTIQFKAANSTTTRITATTDESGNRTSVTLNLPT